jgi:hypothetical protein
LTTKEADSNVVSTRGRVAGSSSSEKESNQGLQGAGEAATASSQANGEVGRDGEAGQSRKSYDFGFVHLKAVDDTGHDQRLTMKV